MSRYKFRLKTLQKIRISHRDAQRTALADAYRAEQILTEQRTSLGEELQALQHRKQSATEGAYLDVNRLVEAQRYEVVLRTKELELAAQEKMLAVEVERRRKTLVEADREVRSLDLLDDRHREQHRHREEKSERVHLDEVARNQWIRREASSERREKQK